MKYSNSGAWLNQALRQHWVNMITVCDSTELIWSLSVTALSQSEGCSRHCLLFRTALSFPKLKISLRIRRSWIVTNWRLKMSWECTYKSSLHPSPSWPALLAATPRPSPLHIRECPGKGGKIEEKFIWNLLQFFRKKNSFYDSIPATQDDWWLGDQSSNLFP